MNSKPKDWFRATAILIFNASYSLEANITVKNSESIQWIRYVSILKGGCKNVVIRRWWHVRGKENERENSISNYSFYPCRTKGRKSEVDVSRQWTSWVSLGPIFLKAVTITLLSKGKRETGSPFVVSTSSVLRAMTFRDPSLNSPHYLQSSLEVSGLTECFPMCGTSLMGGMWDAFRWQMEKYMHACTYTHAYMCMCTHTCI